MSNESHVAGAMSTATGLVKELRPWQWYKQSILLLGIVFSRSLLDPVAWTYVVLGIVSFTAAAGATYIFNDINDVEEDRKHPEKRNRPIASGQVPIAVAAVAGASLVVASLGLAYWLGLAFLATLLAYLGQNVLYSKYLKSVVLVDVIVVAVGFVLRAMAGVFAIGVELSPWLIVCTFLLALVLALGKRQHELETVGDPSETRGVLAEYDDDLLSQLLTIVTASLLMAYALYTFFRADPSMMLSLPFAFFGVFRYYYLVQTSEVAGQPEYLFSDRPFVVNLGIWGVVVVAVLYEVPGLVVGVFP